MAGASMTLADVPWRILCWLYGHKIPPQPSPAEGWWCWRCYQTIRTQEDS